MLWEELDVPLDAEPEVLAAGAVLVEEEELLPEEADVVPEDAPEEELELLVLPEPEEEPLSGWVGFAPLTVTFSVLLVTVQSL